MVRSKTIAIHTKVFSAKDIHCLFDFFASEYNAGSKIAKYKPGVRLRIELKAHDGSSYTTKDSESDIELRAVVNDKKIVNLYFYFSDYNQDNLIILTVKEGEYGRIEIESNDEDWFNAKKGRLEDIVSSVKTQENFYTNNRKFLFHLLSIYLAGNIYWIMVNLTPNNKNSPLDTDLEMLVWIVAVIVSLYMLGSIIAHGIFRYLDRLWPAIEFNFGPDHLRHVQNLRKKLSYIFSVIILPLILSIVTLLL